MASESFEYMCRFCGKKIMTLQSRGRPAPGICPRRNGRPHSWIINRHNKTGTNAAGGISKSKTIEYMCRLCGQKRTMSQSRGRPEPGRCPRTKNGGPHRWLVNRRF